MCKKPFSIKFQLLTDRLSIKKKPKLFKFSFMVIQLYSVNDSKLILDASIKYILETKRFDGPVFQVKKSSSMHSCQNEATEGCFFSLFLLILFHYYHYYYHQHYSIFFFSCSIFSQVIFFIRFCSKLPSFPGNNMYVPVDCNTFLILEKKHKMLNFIFFKLL